MIDFVKQCFIKALFLLSLFFLATITVVANETQQQHGFNNIQHDRILQKVGSITRINIINTVTGTIIGQVSNGMTITLSKYSLSNPNSLSFAAVTSGTVGSVKFTTSGSSIISTVDNYAPFALCGTAGTTYINNISFTI
jgi:hypothetical protein